MNLEQRTWFRLQLGSFENTNSFNVSTTPILVTKFDTSKLKCQEIREAFRLKFSSWFTGLDSICRRTRALMKYGRCLISHLALSEHTRKTVQMAYRTRWARSGTFGYSLALSRNHTLIQSRSYRRLKKHCREDRAGHISRQWKKASVSFEKILPHDRNLS